MDTVNVIHHTDTHTKNIYYIKGKEVYESCFFWHKQEEWFHSFYVPGSHSL